jgi:hypothetical protein
MIRSRPAPTADALKDLKARQARLPAYAGSWLTLGQ